LKKDLHESRRRPDTDLAAEAPAEPLDTRGSLQSYVQVEGSPELRLPPPAERPQRRSGAGL